MSFDPNNNPATHPENNGKKHRYASRTSCVRTLRTDPEAEKAMWKIKNLLTLPSVEGAQGPDAPSFSLIVRRSLKLYCAALLKDGASAVADEQRRVRESSHVPARRYTADYM